MQLPSNLVARTKLRPPNLPPDLVKRPRLQKAITSAVARPISLISAPAGYGKTTVLASWVKYLEQTDEGMKIAWFSLDSLDDDPVLFLAGLIRSLQQIEATLGEGVATLIDDLTTPVSSARRAVAVLVNDILEILPHPFVLIMDDMHQLQNESVYEALAFLLERMPPQMSVIISTRRDPPLPLVRWRTQGRLSELRLDELRFTAGEVDLLLNVQLKLGISSETIASVQERFDGWGAALRLAADFFAHSSLDQRSIDPNLLGQSEQQLFRLLGEEVLAAQEVSVREFLLQTSILDHLTEYLCSAVTGRPDAGLELERLYRRNLFLMISDDAPVAGSATESKQGYRYHDLFRSFLRHRLVQELPGQAAKLHRRAAEAHPVPARAINHYLEAEAWTEAATLIEREGEALLLRGLVSSLYSWIERLPKEVQRDHPALLYLLGVGRLHQRKVNASAESLNTALELGVDPGMEGKILAHLATIAFFQGDFSGGSALISQALSLPIPPTTRARLLLEKARLSLFNGDIEQCDQDVMQAIKVGRETKQPAVYYTLLEGMIPGFYSWAEGLNDFELLCQEAAASIGERPSLRRAVLMQQWAMVHLYRGRTDQVLNTADEAMDLAERFGGLPSFSHWSTVLCSLGIRIVRGEKVKPLPVAEKLLSDRESTPLARGGFLFFVAKFCCMLGHLEMTRRIAENLVGLDSVVGNIMGPLMQPSLNGLIALTEGRLDRAELAFRRAIVIEEQLPRFNFFGSTRILQAACMQEQGRRQDALEQALMALNECNKQGAPGRIIIEGPLVVPVLRLVLERYPEHELANRILKEFGDAASFPHEIKIPETGDTLTQREYEVLALIAEGQTNREVAQSLVVSIHTVKRHVAHILSKLGVTNRTEAASRARELGIL